MNHRFFILVLAAFVGGAAMQAFLHQLSPACADGPVDGANSQSVSGLLIVGKDGKARAKLAMDSKGTPNLWLADKQGNWYPQLKNIDAHASGLEATKTMRAEIKALLARPELKVDKIKVQHILIAYRGAPRIQGITRTLAEAELLTAKLVQQIKAGADFTELMKKHSDDPGPGTYPMTAEGRGSMVAHFGNVGWRLKVGEVGVAPQDARKSPFGFHVIKRLE